MLTDKLMYGAPAPVAAAPTNAVPVVPPPPTSVSASASSYSANPLGSTPDLSGLSPQQRQGIVDTLGRLTWSLPAGGYVFTRDANNANSYWNKFGAGSGGDPLANRQAESVYKLIGEQPTIPNMTTALASLYRATGERPMQGPSYSSILGGFGYGSYRGPYGFGQRMPGYSAYGSYKGVGDTYKYGYSGTGF